MERNTILAVILSSAVLFVFWMLFPPAQPAQRTAAEIETSVQEIPATESSETPRAVSQTTPERTTSSQTSESSFFEELTRPSAPKQAAALPDPLKEEIRIETELVQVVLTNSGGDMVSWKLKEHFDKEENVNMILAGDNETRAFSVAFGCVDSQPLTDLFHVNRLSEYSVEFFRDFTAPGTGETFRLTKRYDFKRNDYMFELTITLDGGYSVSNFNFSGSAYTLAFGPQIGPRFVKLDNRYDYRHYATYTNGKRKNQKINSVIETNPAWAAISGKYFTFIAIPLIAQYKANFSDKAESGLSSASRLNIIRPPISAFKTEDVYRFYLGPKTQGALSIYNTGMNEFGLKDTKLTEVASSGFLAPLEKALKWLLLAFYKIVPNYGIAIIMLTLLVKILFFPLTKKSSEATLRMQALAPKIKELQEKYKDNPQKMNAEMATFYQKEGYNPISGCLPMLLQMPIFFAMYGLFNNHFDLRGAEFIPVWIPDLSVPEYVWNFPGNFKLPLLGWSALRALPFIYVGSQLLYGKVTQMPGQQSNAQMKMMLYVMPIVFFFVLYDMPSGLLIYWIFQNILTLVQQVIINKYIVAKRQSQAGTAPVAGSVIATGDRAAGDRAASDRADRDRADRDRAIASRAKKKKKKK